MTPDNAANRERLYQALRKRGWAWGKPHRGEDEPRSTSTRYVNGVRVNRKPKTAK